jgi:dTDP-glucose 4,6-dehydratase|tara:strand:+ start:244 stop:1179 length:936 start_codon:yes stop_codon:yes gene_type:complete
MTNVLVTGGCGFIGSNFINIMKERYPEIKFVNLDKLDYCSNLYNVNPGVSTFVKGDIRDNNLIGYLIKQYDFDAVFHFAAMSHVDNSFNDPKNFTLNNTYGTHVLLDKFREIKPNVEFIHFSTDEVYGESNTDVPFTEDVGVLKPTNPYSASKAAAEMIVQSYIDSYKMNIKTIRCNNVYGPNQYPEKLIPKFKQALRNGEMCTIHGFKSANIKRAFMHVNDVVDAVEIVWKRGNPGEIYNIASDDEITVLDVTKLIIKLNKNTEEYHRWIKYVDDRPFNDSRYYISSDKLKSLGWSQKKTRDDLINFLGQ